MYHFVSYIAKEGHLYELDGLKDSPINLGIEFYIYSLGSCDTDKWLESAKPAIERRMKELLHFV